MWCSGWCNGLGRDYMMKVDWAKELATVLSRTASTKAEEPALAILQPLGKSLNIVEEAIGAWFRIEPLSAGLALRRHAARPPDLRRHFLCRTYSLIRFPGAVERRRQGLALKTRSSPDRSCRTRRL
jgi:hypothetical protein